MQLARQKHWALGYSLQLNPVREPIGKVGVDEIEDPGMILGPQPGEAETESPSMFDHQWSEEFGAGIAEWIGAVRAWNLVETFVHGFVDFVGNGFA
jgi:hypothetical protein